MKYSIYCFFRYSQTFLVWWSVGDRDLRSFWANWISGTFAACRPARAHQSILLTTGRLTSHAPPVLWRSPKSAPRADTRPAVRACSRLPVVAHIISSCQRVRRRRLRALVSRGSQAEVYSRHRMRRPTAHQWQGSRELAPLACRARCRSSRFVPRSSRARRRCRHPSRCCTITTKLPPPTQVQLATPRGPPPPVQISLSSATIPPPLCRYRTLSAHICILVYTIGSSSFGLSLCSIHILYVFNTTRYTFWL